MSLRVIFGTMFYRVLVTSLVLQAALLLSASAFTAALQGDVLGTDGRPLKGAQVRIERTDKTGPAITTTTDAKGYYTASGLSAGVYRISVVVDGAVKSAVNIKSTGDNARIDFNLKPSSSKKIKHYVWSGEGTGSHMGGRWIEVDASGAPVPGALNINRASGEMTRELARRQANGRP